MKRILLCASLLLLTAHANAQGDPHLCALKASVYENAAAARDNHLPPKTALQMVAAYKDVPLSFRKRAINQVYFNRDFFYAGGRPLYEQVLRLCLYGPEHFKPLK